MLLLRKRAGRIWAGVAMAAALAAVLIAGRGIYMHHQETKPKPYTIVQDGQPTAVIVQQAANPLPWREATLEFQTVIRRASGATLRIVTIEELTGIPDHYVRILIGPGPLTESLGIDADGLPSETYRVASIGNHLVLTGSQPDAVMWAVSDFLDRQLGVRWLWPGEIGTFVPSAATVVLPQLDKTDQPSLEQRILRTGKFAPPEAEQWKRRHMLGSRSSMATGHAFTKWWERYSAEHPEYFAAPPQGRQQMPPDRVKLDIGNPVVDDAIIREWREAGTPDFWNVSPNDGTGFCVSEACMAMDMPETRDADRIWRGEAPLTARYVRFWNRLLDKMRVYNPRVTLSSYAYSAYREPPPNGMKVGESMVLGFVHTYREDAYEGWKGWSDAGARLLLRPNWWHTGAVAPFLSLHDSGAFFAYARDHGMYGFDFDSVHGYWGTQGPNYYLIARMSARPDLSVEEVIAEYTSAFGGAAEAIAEYLDYWETFSRNASYVFPGDELLPASELPDGPYTRIVNENGLSRYPLISHWYVLPYLYTDEVMKQAYRILDRAEDAARQNGGDGYAAERINFLRDGLRHLELTREVIRYGSDKTRPAGATREDFIRLSRQLDELRSKLSVTHVIWKNVIADVEKRRNVPTVVDRTQGWPEETPADGGAGVYDEEYIGM